MNSSAPDERASSAGDDAAKKPRFPPWSEDRVRDELTTFLAGAEVWPSYRDFERAGRRRLRQAVTRFGGARRWAREFGVRYVKRRSGYPTIWTDDRIRTELTDFLSGREGWPSRIEFEQAGRKPLRDAIARTGGPPRWAREFRLKRPDERRGSHRVWTEAKIEKALRKLIGDTGEWPTKGDFLRARKRSLLSAVYMHGGIDLWCARLGVPKPDRRGPSGRQTWTEERIERELRAFCLEVGGWPGYEEFGRRNRLALYRAASRTGGIEHWKVRLGLV